MQSISSSLCCLRRLLHVVLKIASTLSIVVLLANYSFFLLDSNNATTTTTITTTTTTSVTASAVSATASAVSATASAVRDFQGEVVEESYYNNDVNEKRENEDHSINSRSGLRSRRRRRKLYIREDTECVLYLADIQYEYEYESVKAGTVAVAVAVGQVDDTTSSPTTTIPTSSPTTSSPSTYYSKEQWYCEFNSDYARTVLGMDGNPLLELHLGGDLNLNLNDYESIINSNSNSRGEGGGGEGGQRRQQRAGAVVESGKTKMKFNKAIIDRIDSSIYIDKSSIKEIIEIEQEDQEDQDRRTRSRNRNLELDQVPTTGKKKTLVVRIMMYDQSNQILIEPIVTKQDISETIYGKNNTKFSLVKKYNECSYGKLKIKPYRGKIKIKINTNDNDNDTGTTTTTTNNNKIKKVVTKIKNGIINVQLSQDQSNDIINNELITKSTILRYAREATIQKFTGGNSDSDSDSDSIDILKSNFDFVLFCLPENVGYGDDGYGPNFLAFSIINGYSSYYTREFCARPSFTMHDIGHNLGLKHSGEGDNSYSDKTGMMGYSYNDISGPNMCFNPVNNYQLNWYKEQTATYNPYGKSKSRKRKNNKNSSNKRKKFILNGIDDYDKGKLNKKRKSNKKRLIVLRLSVEQTDTDTDNGGDNGGDYYIGYNNQKGINSETQENPNEILILKKLGPIDKVAETRKIGTLAKVGDYYIIENFNSNSNSNSNSNNSVNNINNNNDVYIHFDSLSSNGRDAVIIVTTVPPSLAPSDSPTNTPSSSLLPSSSPSESPTNTVTESPTLQSRNVCEDSIIFRYENDPSKSCSTYVALKPRKRCRKLDKQSGKRIKFFCPNVCNYKNKCREGRRRRRST